MLKAKTERAIWIFIIGFGLIVGVIYYVVPAYNLGEEDYAIGRMRTLVSNEASFAAKHPSDGYSCNLADISVDEVIVHAKPKYEYIFEISDCEEIIDRPRRKYHLVARPLNSKPPAFCSDESGVLRADYAGSVSSCIKNGEPL